MLRDRGRGSGDRDRDRRAHQVGGDRSPGWRAPARVHTVASGTRARVTDHRGRGGPRRSGSVRARVGARHARLGRIPVRDRCDRRTRSRGSTPDGHGLTGDRCSAHGGAPRARTPPRVGRDAGIDHVHLHRQDRNADAQPDDGRRRVDTFGEDHHRRWWVRPQCGDHDDADRRGRDLATVSRGGALRFGTSRSPRR